MRLNDEPKKPPRRSRIDDKDTGRLEAFSDGVFAVAITLLVLNVKVPGLDLSPDKLLDDSFKPTGLWSALSNEWPMLAAYVISFATIGIMWLNHHRLFKHIKRTDTGLLLINLLLLLVIVFIPVPTALLAEYLPRPDLHAAAIVYSGTSFMMACCFNTLWRYASHNNRLLGKDVDPRSVEAISRQYLFGPFFYIVAFALAWVNVPACISLEFILALFFAVPGRPLRSLSEKMEIQGNEEE